MHLRIDSGSFQLRDSIVPSSKFGLDSMIATGLYYNLGLFTDLSIYRHLPDVAGINQALREYFRNVKRDFSLVLHHDRIVFTGQFVLDLFQVSLFVNRRLSCFLEFKQTIFCPTLFLQSLVKLGIRCILSCRKQ
jgi:hypothetical protein